MIDNLDPRWMLGGGLFLLLLGWFLPVLMVMQIIKSTLLLDFLSYVFSLVGLIAGVIGSVTYVSRRRRK